MAQSYEDPIIKKYIELIRAKCGEIKYFYQGEPTRIPASNLPCVIIAKSTTLAGHSTNSEDGHDIGLSITVVTDIRSELSTSENDAHVVEGIAKLYELMEGRNANYTLKDTSILNILRTNLLADGVNQVWTDLSQATRVAYGETLRNRNPEEWTIEARIEILAQFVQIR